MQLILGLLSFGIFLNLLGLIVATFAVFNKTITGLFRSFNARMKGVQKLETQHKLMPTDDGFAEIWQDIQNNHPYLFDASKLEWLSYSPPPLSLTDTVETRGTICNELGSPLMSLSAWYNYFTLAINRKRRLVSFILLAIGVLFVSASSVLSLLNDN